MLKPVNFDETQDSPLTRYEEEWNVAAWVDRWREVAASCTGVLANEARWGRVTVHYFPKFDEAYTQNNPVAFDRLLRNFHVGCPKVLAA